MVPWAGIGPYCNSVGQGYIHCSAQAVEEQCVLRVYDSDFFCRIIFKPGADA
jgi:hypothetical protein